MNVKREMCAFCNKAVYFSERSAADDKVFHKACFRCGECNVILSLGKYASMNNKTYCKPCFKKNFLSKGNYSEGFGELKPQHQHELKKGDSPAVSPAQQRSENAEADTHESAASAHESAASAHEEAASAHEPSAHDETPDTTEAPQQEEVVADA